MTARHVTNVAASIHQRLLDKARAGNHPFNELLQHYAMERFLYRLSESKYADRFVLKGALLLRVWDAPFVRPTMDIDVLSRTSHSPETLVDIVREICRQAVEVDGLEFDNDSVTGESITEEADYAGVRLRFRGKLGTARVTMQIDVGFGDVVTPGPTMVEYPTLLGHQPPKLLAYPRETVIAEKFQVMLHRGMLNSRLRDYYDIWLLSQSFQFDGVLLAKAIKKTCRHRDTLIVERPGGLSTEFAKDLARRTQWTAFRRKSKLDHSPETLALLVEKVASFLGPIAHALAQDDDFQRIWGPPGPWKNV